VSSPVVRYVVLQWKDGSDRPELATDAIFTKLVDADSFARSLNVEAKDNARAFNYTAHEVDMKPVVY
jgi:hypothetical protein